MAGFDLSSLMGGAAGSGTQINPQSAANPVVTSAANSYGNNLATGDFSFGGGNNLNTLMIIAGIAVVAFIFLSSKKGKK